jgi:luciferase family oxidoreductase group 1
MTDELTLSVVDQSPVRRGGTAAEALAESVKLAQAAERVGYRRYWVAEHHNTAAFSGTSPEILIGQIAAGTERIRVGSGGVMLPHYSALKVAEQFLVLESFYPGRIDLGIGRAPGSDRLTAAALVYPRHEAEIGAFPEQVADLLAFLSGELDPGHSFAEIRAQPGPVSATQPEVWLLGSSDYSARLAAKMGLPFSFADFFGPEMEHGHLMTDLYRNEFQPSAYCPEPKVNVTVQALCAPTEEEALFLASSRNLMRANRYWRLGVPPGLLSPEEAVNFPMSEHVRSQMASLGRNSADGDPRQVRERIMETAKRYGAHDVGIVTNCYSFEARVRSFELIADACGVTS